MTVAACARTGPTRRCTRTGRKSILPAPRSQPWVSPASPRHEHASSCHGRPSGARCGRLARRARTCSARVKAVTTTAARQPATTMGKGAPRRRDADRAVVAVIGALPRLGLAVRLAMVLVGDDKEALVGRRCVGGRRAGGEAGLSRLLLLNSSRPACKCVHARGARAGAPAGALTAQRAQPVVRGAVALLHLFEHRRQHDDVAHAGMLQQIHLRWLAFRTRRTIRSRDGQPQPLGRLLRAWCSATFVSTTR